MMRAVVVALAFCLANVLADDEFVPGVWNVPVVPGKADTRLINYYVKRPTNPPPEGGPIFYGVGGRVSVEEIKNQYNLFDFVHNDFFNATVIYVEQRFFGRSKVGRIEKVEDLTSLTLDNVVNDHVVLIQKFAADYNTHNILVFGGGHGGTIAGYVANKFTTDKDLKAKYNVLGWSSSPPTKYLRHVAPEDGKLHDIGKQILDLMKSDADSGQTCVDADALKLPYVFQAIKRWFGNAAGATTGYSIAQALKLDPIPAIKVLTTDPLTDDQKELVAYLRNQIIGFAFEPPFVGTDDTKQPRKLAKLCQIVKPLTGAADSTDVTADVVNRILDLISNAPAGTTRKVQWKVSDDGTGRLNQDLVAATYQDCTDYKIFYCAESANPDDNKGDPLAASQYNLFYTAASTGGCTKLDEYNAGLKAECEGYFGSGFDTTKDLSKETYPAVLTTQVVTTINSKSIFGKSGTFADGTDKNVPNYGFFYYLDGSTDNWEFQTPRSCDGKMVSDVRYSILRAFGCLGNFVQNTDGKTDICPKDKLFDPADADKTDVSGVCTVNKSNKFPFSQTPLGFLPPYHSTVAPTIITTTVTVPTVVSTLATQAPTTSDGNNFLPSAIILASSAMLLFTTL